VAAAPLASDEEVPEPAPAALPLRIKLAYGAPSFAGAGMAIPIVIHLTIFYSDTGAHQRGEPALDPLTQRTLPPPVDRGVPEATGWFLDHFSPRELRRALESGPRVLLQTTSRAAIVWGVIAAAAVFATAREVGSLDAEPGVLAVFGVLVGGFGFTATCFHVVRVRAALKLQRAPVEDALIRRHIEVTRLFKGGHREDRLTRRAAGDLPER
jgi:hypothetical protein